MWLSRSYHRRVRALTNVLLGVTVVSCLLFDWDTFLGTDDHLFRDIRPATRRTLDWLYGVEPPSQPSRREPTK